MIPSIGTSIFNLIQMRPGNLACINVWRRWNIVQLVLKLSERTFNYEYVWAEISACENESNFVNYTF